MTSYESSAKTMEEAVSQGLQKLNCSISDVDIEVLEEGSKGLFGLFGSKLAKVRLTLKDGEDGDSSENLLDALSGVGEIKTQSEKKPQPEKKPAPERKPQPKPVQPQESAVKAEKLAEVKPQAPVKPAEIKDTSTLEGVAQQYLIQLTKLMGVDVSVDVITDEEGALRVNMSGDTLGILIGRRGETLDALQYLTSLQVNKGREDYTRVTLDTENYRAKREEALVRLANRMAARAVKTGRRVSLEPMNPYERRILHSALQNNPQVSTHSEGEEQNRHVVITLNK
jgi:spoIIIJ-associated protein